MSSAMGGCVIEMPYFCGRRPRSTLSRPHLDPGIAVRVARRRGWTASRPHLRGRSSSAPHSRLWSYSQHAAKWLGLRGGSAASWEVLDVWCCLRYWRSCGLDGDWLGGDGVEACELALEVAAGELFAS